MESPLCWEAWNSLTTIWIISGRKFRHSVAVCSPIGGVRPFFVQPLFVQSFSSNTIRLGLNEMDWTKTGWTKTGSTKGGGLAALVRGASSVDGRLVRDHRGPWFWKCFKYIFSFWIYHLNTVMYISSLNFGLVNFEIQDCKLTDFILDPCIFLPIFKFKFPKYGTI